MRIAIDFQGVQNGSRFRGIGRYAASFVKQFIAEASGHEIFIVLNGAFTDTILPLRAELAANVPAERIVVWEPITPVHFAEKNNKGRRLSSEAIREHVLATIAPDVVLVTSMVEGCGDNVVTSVGTFARHLPTAALFYDLIPAVYPDEYLEDPRLAEWHAEKRAHLARVHLLLAISESSRLEAIKYLGVAPERVVTVSTAIEPDYASAAATSAKTLAQKFGITRPFIMYSGASDARKNLPRLIEAFAALPVAVRSKHQLVLAGGMTSDNTETFKQVCRRHALTPDDVTFTGYITDADMTGLYKSAKGLVFASYHEGFGLPILEAMACDLPVIASNAASIPEIIGDAKFMFDPFSVPDISRAIEKLLTDEKFRAALTANGTNRRKLFSWKKTAQTALAALETKFGTRASSPISTPAADEAALCAEVTRCLTEFGHLERGDLVEAATLVDAVLPRDDSQRRLFIDVSGLAARDGTSCPARIASDLIRALMVAPPAGFTVQYLRATVETPYVVANKFMREVFGLASWDSEDGIPQARRGDIFLGLSFDDQITIAQRDFYDHLRRHGVQVHFVVYDMLPQQRAALFTTKDITHHTQWLEVVAQADGLVCISKALADDVKEWHYLVGSRRQTELKLAWFHPSAGLELKAKTVTLPSAATGILSKLKARPTFITVGSISARNRQEQILSACEILWKKGCDINLVMVGAYEGRSADFEDLLLHHPELNHRLIWLDNIEEAYLDALYRASSALIAASLGEGFSLAMLEAAQRGLAIIAREIPLYREIAGEHAHYFTDMAPEALAEALSAWLALHKKNRAPSAKGIKPQTLSQSTAQLLEAIGAQ